MEHFSVLSVKAQKFCVALIKTKTFEQAEPMYFEQFETVVARFSGKAFLTLSNLRNLYLDVNWIGLQSVDSIAKPQQVKRCISR